MSRPGFWRSVLLLAKKDLLLEWRGRARMNATVFFALLVLLQFSFAIGPDPKILGKVASGFFWVALLFASILSLSESMRVERDNGALEGVRLLGVDARALFFAKAGVNALSLVLLSSVMVPVAMVLFSIELKLGAPRLFGVLVLGSLAISAPGTLYAAIAAGARARDVLLPLLLFPVLVPCLLAAVRATQLVMQGDAMGELPAWLQLVGGFALIYWVIGGLLFGRIIEE